MTGQMTITIGLARCGKTTFAEKWQKENPKGIVLEQDEFRNGVYGTRFRLEGEELVRASLITAVRALLPRYDLLVVDTHTGYWNVRQLLTISPTAKAVIFHTPLEVCKHRAIETGQIDLLNSLDRMWENLKITLPMIAKNEIKLDFEEIGPEFRWIRNGYWG